MYWKDFVDLFLYPKFIIYVNTFCCFFPELETKTGLEYLTKLCG